MRKLARAGSGLAIAATLILSACGQARHISPATRTTPTAPTPATMPRTLSVDEAAALIGRTVIGSRPVLLPKAIPVGYTAQVTVSADDFQVTYASVDGSRRIRSGRSLGLRADPGSAAKPTCRSRHSPRIDPKLVYSPWRTLIERSN